MMSQRILSSSIASVEYAPSSRKLTIEYHHGGTYAYLEVPPCEYAALMGADSKGRHLNARIRPRYAHQRLTGGLR